jgi:hypothetical protein
MEAALDKIREVYAQSNASERQTIQEQVRDLERGLYTDLETLLSLGMAVSLAIDPHTTNFAC